MIRDFVEWSTSAELPEHSRLSDLENACIAIDAIEFLTARVLQGPNNEPLLPALGSLPYRMRYIIQADLDRFAELNITPIFVFPGIEQGKRDSDEVFRTSDANARINGQAWELYDQHQADAAVRIFGTSTSVKASDLLRYFQSLLKERKVRFQVAPYSSHAQLAYLSRHVSDVIYAVYGPPELLLYEVDTVITTFDFEESTFIHVNRQRCIQELGNATPDMFLDACLLAGTSYTPTLPQLESRKPNKIRGAMDMMNSFGRSGISLCQNYSEDPQFQKSGYLEKFRKGRFAIKYHVVLTKEGKIKPLDLERAPVDIHEFTSQRLPDELYFYLSKGIIGTRVLNWRAHGEILEVQPLDNGTSDAYRNFIKTTLAPLRNSALSLLSLSLHRFYHHKEVDVRCWFERERSTKIRAADLTDQRSALATWKVKQDLIEQALSKLTISDSPKGKQSDGENPLKSEKVLRVLAKTVRSLIDSTFAAQTITTPPKSKGEANIASQLKSKEEMLDNAVWRFLQLREYVDEQHQLTKWGKVLAIVLQRLKDHPELEEAGFVAVELARHELLTHRNLFSDYSGGPTAGEASDKDYITLVSRIASLGSLRHRDIGYTGPLDRKLLGYSSVINALRASLRDLVEVSLTTLLLNGDAARDGAVMAEIGLELPFLLPNDCALGIAVQTYLNELILHDDPHTPVSKASAKLKARTDYFPECIDVIGDLKIAFKLWDAVYAGIKESGGLVKDRSSWDDVDRWLDNKR